MNIIDNNKLLLPKQENLLRSCSSKSFQIGKYQSLDDILTSLNVDVIIEPGIVTRTIPSALDDAENFWREEANRLESLIPDAEDKESAMEDYQEARKKVDDILKEKELWSTMAVLGLYDPMLNVVKLYPEKMAQVYNGTRMDELLLSTLAHETMHAYFDRPRHKSFPYVIFVEEPLAEFGMLLYLNETGSKYYNWAYHDVSSKKTCYRYGAKLMDQHLKEGPNSSVRHYLEAYKIKLNNYPMPTVNPTDGTITLPTKPHWHDVFKCPPRYTYDHASNTLGLDGDWSEGPIYNSSLPVDIDIMIDVRILHHNLIKRIYLGDNFTINLFHLLDDLLSKYQVFVSPANKQFYANNGVPFYKNDDTPVLDECDDGLYKLCRKGKWGVVDEKLNQIVPFKYDYIWLFDDNDLAMVENCDKYGLVNKQGEEQVPVKYENINENSDGTYTVKQKGTEFKIDKFGKKIK